jgi:hypothetical protein
MKLSEVRHYAMALPEVTEEPHHEAASFRVRGKIFVTVPPKGDYIHVFVNETAREQAIALYPSFVEKLFWGGKVWGIRVILGAAKPSVVKGFIRAAWTTKAPKRLADSYQGNSDGEA